MFHLISRMLFLMSVVMIMFMLSGMSVFVKADQFKLLALKFEYRKKRRSSRSCYDFQIFAVYRHRYFY
jgi:hypothetical protein